MNFITRNRSTIQRICLLSALFHLLLLATACSTAWTSEAVNIIAVLEPAIMSALSILAAFGLGIPPVALSAINAWGSSATNALNNVVKPLIDQYNTAEATAKPGILTEIETAINTITSGLAQILPTLKITDPATQAKVTAVIEAIQAEMQALLNLVPVVQGQVTEHEAVMARFVALKPVKQFKKDFNEKVMALGPDAAKFKL